MKSQITYVTWRCTVVPPGEYDGYARSCWNMEYQSNTSHRDVSVRCWWDKGMILQDIAKTSTFFDQVTTEGFAETMGSGVFGKWFTQYGACHYHCCLYNLLVRVVYVCCVEELQCRCIVKV